MPRKLTKEELEAINNPVAAPHESLDETLAANGGAGGGSSAGYRVSGPIGSSIPTPAASPLAPLHPLVQQYIAQKMTPYDDTEMQDAQGASRRNSLIALLSKAGAMGGAAIAGIKPQTEIQDTLEQNADRPVAEIKQRRADEMSDLTTQGQRYGIQKSMNDANQAAHDYQEAHREDSPEAQTWSAAIGSFPFLADFAKQMKDRNIPINAATMEKMRPFLEAVAKNNLGDLESRRKFEATNHATEVKGATAAGKAATKEAENNGYTHFRIRPGRSVQPTEARKFREAVSGADQFADNVDTVEAIVKNVGTGKVLPDADWARLNALTTSMQDQFRIGSGYGAPQGSEIARSAEIIPKLTGIREAAKSGVGLSTAISSLRQVRDNLLGKVTHQADSLGLDPIDGRYTAYGKMTGNGQVPAPVQDGHAPTPGKTRMYAVTMKGKNGHSVTVNYSEQDAQKYQNNPDFMVREIR